VSALADGPRDLWPAHLEELTDGSGIFLAVVEERGYRTVANTHELQKLGFGKGVPVPGWVAPVYRLNKRESYCYKPDRPREVVGENRKARTLKYEAPHGGENWLDCPPRCRDDVRDPSVALLITEGVKKADAAASHGLCCVAFPGVWNWKGKNGSGGSEPIPDLEYLTLKSPDGPREVVIVFDSDARSNPHVREARKRLAGLLRSRGANVGYINLPDRPDGAKQGLDDFLLTHTADELLALRVEPDDLEGRRRSQADTLLEVAASLELWHDQDGEPYADVWHEQRRQTHPVRSRALKRWLSHQHHKREGRAPNAQAVEDAIRTLEGRALFDGPQLPVYTRVAPDSDGAIWLDLADERWAVVRIDGEGWKEYAGDAMKGARFRRRPGMSPLPSPVSGGDLDDLWRFVNVRREDRPLVLAWLLAALRPTGPYPVLVLHGEQGSAKSTTGRALRDLVDPNRASLRAAPRDEHDLVIAAANAWVVALDNLSRVQPWLSDALCRLATGGGFATRELYTNDDEAIFDSQRPIELTGIEELATRGDLLDRSLVLQLPTMPDGERRTEAELWRAFDVARPRLLGALLDATSAAIRELPHVRLEALPRMADFATWAVAGELALGLAPGAFLRAYADNRAASNSLALESSPVAPALAMLLQAQPEREGVREWSGTAGELLAALEARTDDATRRLRSWP